MTTTTPRRRLLLILGGILLTLLLAAVFTLGSLDAPVQPRSWRDILPLYAVSSFITALLLVFVLILFRTVLRLSAERSREHLGARFKTKMVLGAMGISLLPVFVMFLVSYSLLNRTLARWFPRPLEIAAEQSSSLISEMGAAEYERLAKLAVQVRPIAIQNSDVLVLRLGLTLPCDAADAFWHAKSKNTPTAFQYCVQDKDGRRIP